MSSEILWINHAGYELRAGGLKIVHDPWLVGYAFDNGWSLISETSYSPQDFADVDYIWFSHEHPDHFSVPSIKSIPQEFRERITVLFQETRDKRVVRFCEKAGFKVIELKNGVRTALNEHVAVTCGAVLGRDSWIYTETPDATIFNANDCVGVDWVKVASQLPRPVDVLMTQFSYANWVGNPGEDQRMKQVAEEKLAEMREQIRIFKPHEVIPFASFVWFCRQQNFHMNEHANRIEDVAREIEKNVPVVVLYPGDSHVVGQAHDNRKSIERYQADWKRHDKPLEIAENQVSIPELQELAQKEQARLKRENWIWAIAPLAWLNIVKPISIYLDDLAEGIRYSMFGGILASGLEKQHCEIAFSSHSFAGMLRNGYGYGTLAINGRYIEMEAGAADRLSRHFAIAARNEEGDFVPGVFLRQEYMLFQVRRLLGGSA